MRITQVFIFCCFSVVCVAASAVLEVSGHVGGEVSIHCSSSWTTDNSSEHYNMYFCRADCSRENTLIQTKRKTLTIARRGRYSMEVNRRDGAFNVTMKMLKREDAGRYYCGVGKTLNVLYQEVNLIVLNASTVPPGSPPSTTILQTEAETLTQSSLTSSTAPSPTTLPAAEDKTIQQAPAKLTEEAEFPQTAVSVKSTTVVIIVSVSLALLVCAIIPIIFYGHCRSNPEGQKGEGDCCEENTDVASTHSAVRLQSLDPDTDPEDASQYAAIYQALDPKSLD